MNIKAALIWIFTIVNACWGALNLATTYATLPEDIEEFWSENMMGMPMFPAIMLVIGLVLLAWVYFPWWSRLFSQIQKQPRHLQIEALSCINLQTQASSIPEILI